MNTTAISRSSPSGARSPSSTACATSWPTWRLKRSRRRSRSAMSSAVRPAAPTNVCANSSCSSDGWVENGPMSLAVNVTVMPARTRLPTAAPGCQNRSVAQISGGKTRKVSGVFCEKTSAPTPTRTDATRAASSGRSVTRLKGQCVTPTNSAAATTTSPIMSANHQVRHSLGNWLLSTSPASSRLPTPTLALMAVLTPPASTTRATTSRRRSSEGLKPATWCRSQAPARASRVFPSVMPSAA